MSETDAGLNLKERCVTCKHVEAAIGFLSAPERERVLERLGYTDAEIAAYFRARGEAALPCLQPREGL